MGRKTIGYCAFENCHGLTNISIPNSVKIVEVNAFYNCSNLKTVTIGNSTKSIGVYAFEDCRELTSINVDENNPTYSSEDGVLYNKNKDTLICCPEGKTGLMEIPNTVKTIGDYAFSFCGNLSSIAIPGSVTSIGVDAFRECGGLTDITKNQIKTIRSTMSRL